MEMDNSYQAASQTVMTLPAIIFISRIEKIKLVLKTCLKLA